MPPPAADVRLSPGLARACAELGLVPVPRGQFMDGAVVEAALARLEVFDQVRIRNCLKIAGQLDSGRR